MTLSVFEQMGGEAGVRALVDAFYDRMAQDAACAELLAMHPADLGSSRDKLFWFLCGWTGGPNYFIERFGHPMLRARHLPFSIGVAQRDQWLRCMDHALTCAELPAPLREQLAGAFGKTADFMRNSG